MENIAFFIASIGIILLTITIHEYAHGMAAEMFGDPTPRLSGRLTLNPVAHIDPIGLLMLIIVRFGWAKPVPINPNNFKDPEKDMAIVGLAGPIANFAAAWLISIIAKAVPLPVNATGYFMGQLFQYTIWINVALGVFNLIPIPPLDGSRLLKAVLPYQAGRALDDLERYGFILLVLLLILPGFSYFLMTIVNSLTSFLL